MGDLIGDLYRLAPQQYRVLVAIQRQVEAGQGFPELQALQDLMGWKHQRSVLSVLCKLRHRGFLTSKPSIGVGVKHEWHLMCRFQKADVRGIR